MLSLVAAIAVAAHPGTPIIFDSDLGYDVDDVGAMAVLHALADRGEARILATMAVVGDVHSAPAMDVINTYYGRPDLPIGQNKRGRWLTAHPYWRKPDTRFVQNLAQEFPNDVTAENVPDAVALYRKVLAAQPDRSVVIVAVGFLANISDLMDSGPDEFSDRNGVDLIRAKVARLVVMGGSYPRGKRDFNLTDGPERDPASAQKVARAFPAAIDFVPLGGGLLTGDTLSTRTATSNPVRRAYELFFGRQGVGRDSWDPITVLYAVRTSGFQRETDREFRLNDDLTHEWVPGKSRHARITSTVAKAEMKDALERLITQEPSRP